MLVDGDSDLPLDEKSYVDLESLVEGGSDLPLDENSSVDLESLVEGGSTVFETETSNDGFVLFIVTSLAGDSPLFLDNGEG